MAEDTQDKKSNAQSDEAAKSKGATKSKKKEKPPAIEDKPFDEFITQHFMPNLKESLANQGISDLDLEFEKRPIPLKGFDESSACWQVIGHWRGAQRTFFVAFQKEDITGPKFFAASDYGAHPTTLESFMIDERRVNLDLMVFYVIQRLNGQKWLSRN